MAEAWQIAPIGDLHFGVWDDSDEVVVYYDGSGDTYLISQLGYIILSQLKESARTREELINTVASLGHSGDDLPSIPEEMVDAHLFHFKKLGLVES